MLKPFTAEGRFECGLDAAMARKGLWAFTAVLDHEGHYEAALGVATANEPGYTPIPTHWCHADTWDEMQRHAEELNEAEGLTRMEAVRIVASSMGKGKVPKRIRTRARA